MIINDQKGIALTTVILFLVILSLSWVSFFFINSYEAEIVKNQIASDQAAYIAEAGVQQGLWFLSQDWNWQNWTDNKWGNGGTRVTGGNLTYYQWSGNLGDSTKTYTVQIRNDGTIQSKIVAAGTVGSSNRTITVELGSAFDYGLYSHKGLEFRTRNFRVTGSNQQGNQAGYVYAKASITGSSLLTADKVTGNFQSAPRNLPKEIPLPELWKTKNPQTGAITGFNAKINGTPTSTTILYNNDSGEAMLEIGAVLHNKTLPTRLASGNFFRKITGCNIATNTITTEASAGDGWAANDKIVVERIEVYENYWNTLKQQCNNLANASYGLTYPNPSYELGSSQSFSNAYFTATPTVEFKGDSTFSGNIKIDGNAIFGRRYDSSGTGSTTINGDMLIKGNAYFFNGVTISGHLYVAGFLYIFDNNNLSTDYYRNNWLFLAEPVYDDWREYFKTADYNSDGHADFDLNWDGVIDYPEIDPYVDTGTSTTHGITIAPEGGVFVGKKANLQEFVQGASFIINGYFYVNDNVTIYHGCTTFNWRGTTIINNYNNSVARAFYVRNDSLNLGNTDLSWNRLTNLQGSGRIIVGKDITITSDLYAPQSAAPLLTASGGNLQVQGYVGYQGIPFYGLVYAGENASFGNIITMSGGLMVVNGFGPNRLYLSGSSIYRPIFDKNLLKDAGFNNNKDFIRPLFWRGAN